jgi:hypothetical protein
VHAFCVYLLLDAIQWTLDAAIQPCIACILPLSLATTCTTFLLWFAAQQRDNSPVVLPILLCAVCRVLQTRLILPSWLGVGDALNQLIRDVSAWAVAVFELKTLPISAGAAAAGTLETCHAVMLIA